MKFQFPFCCMPIPEKWQSSFLRLGYSTSGENCCINISSRGFVTILIISWNVDIIGNSFCLVYNKDMMKPIKKCAWTPLSKYVVHDVILFSLWVEDVNYGFQMCSFVAILEVLHFYYVMCIHVLSYCNRRQEVLMLGLGWCKNWLVLETIGLPKLWLKLLMKKLHTWLWVSSGSFRFVRKWDAPLALLSEVHFISSVLLRCSHSLASLENSPISFTDLLEEYNVEVKGPFNHLAREKAGLPREW